MAYFWCMVDVSSVSPSSDRAVYFIRPKNIPYQPLLNKNQTQFTCQRRKSFLFKTSLPVFIFTVLNSLELVLNILKEELMNIKHQGQANTVKLNYCCSFTPFINFCTSIKEYWISLPRKLSFVSCNNCSRFIYLNVNRKCN